MREAEWTGTGASILPAISDYFGLTGLELRHYKAAEGQKYQGKVELILMTLDEVRSIAIDLIGDTNFLMVYEYPPLSVCVVVRKKKGTTE